MRSAPSTPRSIRSATPFGWRMHAPAVVARVVLKHVRGQLPIGALKNQLRASVAGLVEAASVEKLGDPGVLVPVEVRSLLDPMATG